MLTPPLPWREVYDFDADPGTDEGWARDTRHSWLRDWRGFAEFFFAELLPEAHSSKQYEDCVGLGRLGMNHHPDRAHDRRRSC